MSKWEYDGKPIVPLYYEAQARHYMAVMNLDRVYFCCLYGNSEEDVMIRSIDRDPDYEAELIALEEDFWEHHVKAKVPPPYIEDDGALILASLRRCLGPSREDAPPAALTQTQAENVRRYLELRTQRSTLNSGVRRLEKEMERLKARIIAGMRGSCYATLMIGSRLWPHRGLSRLTGNSSSILWRISFPSAECRRNVL